MDNKLDVLYQFDDKYAPFAGISMISLFENNKQIENITVYCAAMDVSEDNKIKIEKQAQKYQREIIWIDINKALEYIESFNVQGWNGSLATWLKIFVVHEMPEQVKRLIYIDCDTLVLDDLSSLMSINMEESPIGCVLDSVGFVYSELLNTARYYNAGVILYNVDYWKNNSNFERMLDHLKKNIKRYHCNDQDLLNDFCDNKIFTLPVKFNLQGIHYLYSEKVFFKAYGQNDYYSTEELQDATMKPAIVHFFRIMGKYPWEKNNIHPLRKQFLEWKERSMWSEMKDIETEIGFIYKIETVMFKVLPKACFIKIFKYITEKNAKGLYKE